MAGNGLGNGIACVFPEAVRGSIDFSLSLLRRLGFRGHIQAAVRLPALFLLHQLFLEFSCHPAAHSFLYGTDAPIALFFDFVCFFPLPCFGQDRHLL